MKEKKSYENKESFLIVNGIRNVICKKWSLAIINAIDSGIQLRYSDLTSVFEGISPTILSSTLQELEREKIIKKETFNEIPPRTEYSILQRGKELLKAIIPLKKWAETR